MRGNEPGNFAMVTIKWPPPLKIFIFLPFFIACFLPTGSVCAGSWPGVDESVVEKIAGEHGHEAHKPLLDPGEGDLLLFVFLLAGALGGFVAGYCWRKLLVEDPRKDNHCHGPL